MDEQNSNYKITVENRLATLEVKVNEIMTNHLPHLEAKVDRMQWLIISTLVSILVLLIKTFVKV